MQSLSWIALVAFVSFRATLGQDAIPATQVTSASTIPLPSDEILVTGTINSQAVTQTFVPFTNSQYSTLQSITTIQTLNSQSSSILVVAAPGGVGWTPLDLPPSEAALPAPTILPSISSGTSSTNVLSSRRSSISGTSSSLSPTPGSTTPVNLPQTSSSTTLDGAPLILVTTSYDPQATSVTSLDPSITGNTAIRTSDDRHPLGLFPIIKGGPGCDFCPPGLDKGGLVLFGMAKPGVYPPPTPPPYPGIKNFPTITIGNDLQPTESSEDQHSTTATPSSTGPSSSSSTSAPSSCTTSAIVSDCSVICYTAGPGTTASASASCSTSCSATATGCSVSGTTITSAASDSACEQPGPFTSMTSAVAASYSWETEYYVTLSGVSSATSTSDISSSSSNSISTISSSPVNSLVPLPVSTDPPGPLKDDTSCEGTAGSTASDIFSCSDNATLFQLFAPLGTAVSLDEGSDDKGGWATWKGAGCYCNQGVFCCSPDAKAPIDADGGSYNQIDIDGQGTDIVAYYKELLTTAGGGCTCDGSKSAIEKRVSELHENYHSSDGRLSGMAIRNNRRDVDSHGKHATKSLIRRVDRSAAWNTYASKGQGYWDAFNNRDPTLADSVLCNVLATYNIEQYSKTIPAVSFQPFLTLINSQMTSAYQVLLTWEAPAGKQDADLFNLFDPDSGTIVAAANDIGDAPDHWSDIAWYLWVRACLTKNPTTTSFGNVNTIIQRNIDNSDTWDIISDALSGGYTVGQTKYFTPADRDLNANAFWALLGSPNGNGIIHMLTDHKHQLNGKSIVRIGLWANPNQRTPGQGYETHMWAELTP